MKTIHVKLFSMALLAILTSTVTSAIVSRSHATVRGVQRGQDKAGVADELRVLEKVEKTVVAPFRGGQSQPAKVSSIEVQTEAEFSVRSCRVVTHGNFATVQIQVHMKDLRQGLRYYWSLQISDMQGKPVQGQDYLDQVFSLPPEREASPTFKETFFLDPGKYRVQVTLLGFLLNGNPENVVDAIKAKARPLVSSTRPVVILP